MPHNRNNGILRGSPLNSTLFMITINEVTKIYIQKWLTQHAFRKSRNDEKVRKKVTVRSQKRYFNQQEKMTGFGT